MTFEAESSPYAALIEPLIADLSAFVPETESDIAVQVERGTLFPSALQHPLSPSDPRLGRLIDLAQANLTEQTTILDRHGHRRPFYRGLLAYSCLRALQLTQAHLVNDESAPWRTALRIWCATLPQQVETVPWGSVLPASHGEHVAEACWNALALHAAGLILEHAPWSTAAATAFAGLAQGQQINGAFLLTSASDNPETFWYHELLILHAIASYAADTADPAATAAIRRNAMFHLNETQPDHATTQPLALFAFAGNPATRSLADQILHAVRIQHPAGVPGVAAMLLADAVYCLRQSPR